MNHPFLIMELVASIIDSNPEGITTPNSDLLPIGTMVRSDMTGRATGTIVAYNRTPECGMYRSSRYPYVIQFEDGYRDYYGIEGGITLA